MYIFKIGMGLSTSFPGWDRFYFIHNVINFDLEAAVGAVAARYPLQHTMNAKAKAVRNSHKRNEPKVKNILQDTVCKTL